jgi:FkbM family methyltransferase
MLIVMRRSTLFKRLCFAQDGEDQVLASLLFPSEEKGFYVDVGAHDPMRFSNTYLLYRKGWRGVNIDAAPGSMRLFRKHRRRDINIESGVGLTRGTVPFYVFSDPAVNSFDQQLSASRDAEGPHRIKEVVDVQVSPLSDLIRDHIPPGTDYPSVLNVDVEGLDLEVLQSNDWAAFRPRYVLAETYGVTVDEAIQGPVSVFMRSMGYRFMAKTVNTAFYQES